MKTMRSLLRYLEVCDCKMQEGSLRFELNVSLRPEGTEEYGTKVEVKNVGSIRSVLRALDYEVNRQTEILEDGGHVVQETRLWDDARGETRPHAHQGRGQGLPLLPRTRPAAVPYGPGPFSTASV